MTCEGMALDTILSKNVGADGLIAGSVEDDFKAASTSLEPLILRIPITFSLLLPLLLCITQFLNAIKVIELLLKCVRYVCNLEYTSATDNLGANEREHNRPNSKLIFLLLLIGTDGQIVNLRGTILS